MGVKMFLKSSKTWLGTIALASILMMLAIFGGNWGTSYAKPSEPAAAPVITSIDPKYVHVTSGNTLMVIRGTNLGTQDVTRVRFYQWDSSVVYELVPQHVQSELIVVEIPGNMTDQPHKYNVMVVVYSSTPTVPTLPTIPGQNSNLAVFSAFEPIYYYLPCIHRR
jgi:hypothetical protein